MSADDYRPLAIEDYALIGDCHTAALVGRNGSIDWLCWPHFDSDACMAALLGDGSHGRWLLAPADPAAGSMRRYRGDTLILETVFETADGAAAVVDFMPVETDGRTIVRQVEGRRGRVPFATLFAPRFEYGSVRPWVETLEGGDGLQAVAGRNRVVLRASAGVDLRHDRGDIRAAFDVCEGQTVTLVAGWGPSHLPAPGAVDAAQAYAQTKAAWTRWAERSTYQGPAKAAVIRSLLTLKALSFTPTGALVAAPHDLTSRADRRSPQLGLPLLLA